MKKTVNIIGRCPWSGWAWLGGRLPEERGEGVEPSDPLTTVASGTIEQEKCKL
jgi:hypothetical protein